MEKSSDEEYETCLETFVTLRVFSSQLSIDDISRLLQIQPSSTIDALDAQHNGDRPSFNGWFFSTKGLIDSLDCRRHIDHITKMLACVSAAFKDIRGGDSEIDMICFWLSAGQGGPILSTKQLRDLAQLEIEIGWEIYFQHGFAS